MATILATLLITLYMILVPARWVKHLMQLTRTSWDFELFMISLGLLYLACAWVSEKYLFQRLARLLGQVKEGLSRQPKKRKEYKLILEQMRL